MKDFTFFYELDKLTGFLEMFSTFYGLISNTIFLHKNKTLEKQINIGHHINKSISQIYYENNLLSNKILEQEKHMISLGNRKSTHVIPFMKEVVKLREPDASRYFEYAGRFYFEKIREKEILKEGVKYFE